MVNIKRFLLSGLFSLVSGATMMSFGAKSEAEVTTWVEGYPKVTRNGNALSHGFDINLLCQATSQGQDALSWASVTYIIAGYINTAIRENTTIPAGQTVQDITGGDLYSGVGPGSYDCLAIASGTDTVTGVAWSGSTGDTWITCQ